MTSADGDDLLNIGIYGDSPYVVLLAASLAGESRILLTHAAEVRDNGAELLRAAPGLQLTADWQDLLGQNLDALIVCLSQRADSEAVRRLAAEVPQVVLLIDGVPDLTLLYELSLIHDDTGVVLLPWLPELPVPEFPASVLPGQPEKAGAFLQEIPPKYVQVEVGFSASALSGAPHVPQIQLERQLLLDLLLLVRLCGDFTRITAVYGGPEAGLISTAAVTLNTVRRIPVSWNMRTAETPAWSMRISGDTAGHLLEPAGNPESVSESRRLAWGSGETDAGSFAVDTVLRQLASPERTSCRPTWTDLLRAVETLDAARRSARRGRTVDLHFETTSERSQFKTQMIAMGCGVLSLTLLAMVLVLLIGEALQPPAAVMQVLRLLVFAPLVVFLLLQALLLIARPARRGQPGGTDASHRDDPQETRHGT